MDTKDKTSYQAPQSPVSFKSASWIKPQMSWILTLIVVASIYAAIAIGGLSVAVVGDSISLIWAPSGIALAALLLLGNRMLPAVALGAFVANAWTDVPIVVAAGIALGNTLEALLGAWLLHRYARFQTKLDRRRDVFALMGLAAVLGTLLSACVGVSTLALGGLISQQDWLDAGIKWWLGDMMGVLVVAPALLVWLGHKTPALSAAVGFEAVVLSAAILLASYLIFGAPEMAGRGYYPAALAVFPFVIWGALRFGQQGSTLLTLCVSILAVWGTTQGTGPFVVDNPVDSLVRWCTFAIVVAVTGLLLAASVAEQRRAQGELKQSLAELEHQVSQRTSELQRANSELHREMIERRQLESELIRVSEVQQQAMGRELHDGLGQHLTSLALMSVALQQRLRESMSPEADAAARILELANESSAMTRALARGLYPVALEFGGLPAALDRLTEQVREHGEMNCDFICDPQIGKIQSMVSLNLYRIAQEAVNNALKYSEASRIQIQLSKVEEVFHLSIGDNGVGIDHHHPVHQHGLGMHSMRYRAGLMGGKMLINEQVLGGTLITVMVPNVKEKS